MGGEGGRVSAELWVVRLGVVPYRDALVLQEAVRERRQRDELPDVLLLLEHPPVYTRGRRSRDDELAFTPQWYADQGIELVTVPRGGLLTYHGPGQLVGYPILDLKPDRCDLHRYVRDIEEALIRALGDFGVEAGRMEGMTGVWVGGEKVAAIGVRVSSGWITSHGFALNVNTDLNFFDAIVPCGIREYGVTSLARLTGESADLDVVGERVAERFAEVFEREIA